MSHTFIVIVIIIMLTLHCVTKKIKDNSNSNHNVILHIRRYSQRYTERKREIERKKKTSPTSLTGSVYAVTTSMQKLKTIGHDESWTLRA